MYSTLCERLNSAGVSGLESALQDHVELDKWVRTQQSAKKRGVLSQQKQTALEKVGFPWECPKKPKESSKPTWEDTFVKLSEFYKSHGHCDMKLAVPLNDVELDKWVRAQRAARRKGVLSPQRQSALDEIGFPWEFPKQPKESSKPTWEDSFTKLAEFYKSHGHCDMKLVTPMNEKLHKWALEQRRAKQEGVITSYQIRQLDQLGFIWDKHNFLWERMLRVLVAYKSIHGDCNVPRYWQKNLQLAVWVASQRIQRRKGLLQRDYVERLDGLSFQW